MINKLFRTECLHELGDFWVINKGGVPLINPYLNEDKHCDGQLLSAGLIAYISNNLILNSLIEKFEKTYSVNEIKNWNHSQDAFNKLNKHLQLYIKLGNI